MNNLLMNKGPYHMKRVGLGSYSLLKASLFNKPELDEYFRMKDNEPIALVELMTPYFIRFFKNNNFGFLDFITVPPRSIRNIEKAHPMDIVLQHLAVEFNWVGMQGKIFKPWNKPNRGIHSLFWNGEPELKEEYKYGKLRRKVIYVIDDFSTTGQTIRKSIRCLTEAGAHAHGIVFLTF